MAVEPTFAELLAACQRTAVHLEMRDGYSRKSPAFVNWQVDRSVSPLTWYGAWLDIVGAAVQRGVTVRRRDRERAGQRLHPVGVRHHLLTTSRPVKDIRWPARRRASDLLPLPGNDFWVFDDRLVLWLTTSPARATRSLPERAGR